MPHYPINLDLRNRRCLVIGGGSVGERKAEMLLDFGAVVVVVSPDVTHKLHQLVDQGLVRQVHSVYTPEVLADAFLVIAATNMQAVNKAISVECQKRGVLVNVVDDPELCTFFVPAVVRRGDFVVGVSTSGNSPSLAKRVRENLEDEFGPEYSALTEILGQLRDDVKARYPDQDDRAKTYLRILDSDVLDLLKQGKRDEAMERARKCI
jgi:precorrin-2 dehydrogenase / sirohydrochlorin ferrochelatase